VYQSNETVEQNLVDEQTESELARKPASQAEIPNSGAISRILEQSVVLDLPRSASPSAEIDRPR
jgi:hypothetical protein